MAIKSFEDLDAWKIARLLRQNIAALARQLPSEEKYRLVDQMIRASRSVTANLAEGYGRFHYQETIQFARQARGSLYELLDHLHTANDAGYLDKAAVTDNQKLVRRAIEVVNGYIRYLNSRTRIPRTA